MRKVLKKGSFVLGVLSILLLFKICLSATSCIQNEREALLRLKKSFDDPSGRLASWNYHNGSNCCFWDGIACHRTTGHVSKIDLGNYFEVHSHPYYTALYSNSVDSSLSEFKYLHYLSLSWNHFNYSEIPNFLSFMFELRYLDLSYASFARKTPPHFGNLSQLVYLDLSFNYIEETEYIGDVDNVEWISHLSSLRYLGLNGMKFSEAWNTIEMLTSLPLLSSLKLSSCNLQNIHLFLGSLNSSFITRVQLLELSFNNFSSPIPTSLGNFSSLEYLYLSVNDLTGAIPVTRLSNLRELHLEGNRLEEVGRECFIHLRNLEELDISNNLLKGVLTEAHFVNLSQLHSFDFYGNEFLMLDIKPTWVPPFQLKVLSGGSCNDCIGSEFPRWLQTQKTLLILVLSNMSISSALPTWFRAQNIVLLDLSHNRIVGPIPISFGDQMPSLTNLDLSYNQLMGSIPMNIGNKIPNLEIVMLSNNHINDSLPPSLCKLNNLKILDLSNNRLSGMVQGCLLTSLLQSLDLSLNKFSGTFPCSHENSLSDIQQLYLGNNNFEGSFPIVLKNSISLEVLGLEGNKFSGNIPTWVGNNLENLKILRLRDNLFNGTIPSSLCNLTNLQILDLAHNQFQGSIPSNLNNFHVMTGKNKRENIFFLCISSEYCSGLNKNVEQSIKSGYFNYSLSRLGLMVNIDLSENYLTGCIPSEITMLKELVGLNLSHNNLTGTIPAKIGKMKSLESLDLSFNQLSGPIPRSISELNDLGALELSHNNLSGDIPREGHLSTFNNASSFDGNHYLCGEPLAVKCSSIKSLIESPFKIENAVEEDDKWERWMLYIMIILGYIIGFWVVVGSLVLKRSWRYAYFNFVDDTKYKLHVAMRWTKESLKKICTHLGNGA